MSPSRSFPSRPGLRLPLSWLVISLCALACASGGGSGGEAVGPYGWGATPRQEAQPEPAQAAQPDAEPAAEPDVPQDSEQGSEPASDEGAVVAEQTTAEPAPPSQSFGDSAINPSDYLPWPVGPEEPAEWHVLSPKHSDRGDTLSVQNPTEGLRIEDTIIQASPRTAMILYEHRGPFEDVVLQDVILRVEPGMLPSDRAYWGLRGYDVIDMLLDRVEITGFGKVTPKHDEGHAIYLNLRGSFTLEGGNIHHNGGQGLQLVNRPAESNFPPGPAEGFIALRNTLFLENGFNPDRGGFQVSIFGTGQDVRMQDVLIAAGHDRTEYPNGMTGGGLVIEAERFDEWGKRPVWYRPVELPPDFEMPFTQGDVELVRVHIHQRAANRPIAQIKGCRSLTVRECTFGEGRIEIDAPDKPGRDSGSIVWQGNSGPAVVYLRGERMGPASTDFVIEPVAAEPGAAETPAAPPEGPGD